VFEGAQHSQFPRWGKLFSGGKVWNNTWFPPQKWLVINNVIDAEGFRPNVGIILANDQGRVLWARRVQQDAWQFAQGGINQGESPEQALYRELHEEVGLTPDAVKVLACTRNWLRYRLPKRYLRKGQKPLCIGQKQKWFLLQMLADDAAVTLDASDKPEFDDWRWVSYWYPLTQVIAFKREVYRSALRELAIPLGKMGRVPVAEH
jgi:putative (di)nucleoside polyphosphate hydrolase